MSGLSGDTGAGAGMGNLGDMLALMANPKALQSKYAELAARQKAAEDAVALVGPANQIVQLRDAASKANEEAKTALADAKVQAKRLIDQAQNSATDIIAKANKDAEAIRAAAQKVKDDADKVAKDAAAASAQSNKRSQELDTKAKQITSDQATLNDRAAAVTARELAVEDKAKSLKYVRDQLLAQLAEHGKYLSKV